MNDISIFVMGDVVVKNEFEINKELISIASECDFNFLNMEAPITEEKKNIVKAGATIKNSTRIIEFLKALKIDCVSLANNHMYDYGSKGVEDTINILESNEIGYAGVGKNSKQAYDFYIKEVKGIKIGVIALAECQFGVIDEINNIEYGIAWINGTDVNSIIKESKSKCDLLLVSVHAGVEDMPLPQYEWRERYKKLCDCGADLIIGHHTHSVQGFEMYNDKLIVYSLGNGYFDKGVDLNSFHKEHGYGLKIKIVDGKINNTCIIPLENKSNKLEIYNNSKFIDYIEKLNSILKNPEKYNELVKQQNIWIYNNIYIRGLYDYNNKYLPHTSYIKYLCKKIKKIYMNLTQHKSAYRYSSLVLYHYFKIESHRYVIMEVNKLIYENQIVSINENFKKLLNLQEGEFQYLEII